MNEDDKPESLGDCLKLSTEDKLRLVTTPDKPKSETPIIAEDLCCEVERLQDELAGTKEALYTEALERDRYREALQRIHAINAYASNNLEDDLRMIWKIVGEALNQPTPKPDDAVTREGG